MCLASGCSIPLPLLFNPGGSAEYTQALLIYPSPTVFLPDDKLLNLDPHYCQVAVNVNSSDFDIRSYHCRIPRKLTASRMDPSCTIGFYCHSREEFSILRRKTEPVSQTHTLSNSLLLRLLCVKHSTANTYVHVLL